MRPGNNTGGVSGFFNGGNKGTIPEKEQFIAR